MNLSGFEFLLLALATFRLTRLIVFDKITTFLRSPFLEEVEEVEGDGTVVTYIEVKGNGIKKWIGELLSCYWCAGIWCAVLLLVFYDVWPTVMEFIIIVLAITGAAGFLESVVNRLTDY
ncbi:DUF1360 domain-containing protein [Oceanobacillus caeni]|uniref:DUF1360 domain-containing protein n=1 Tax=Oceanobacillus TaxID=182709 RepID=UPI000621EF3A|nr:DUF1360 domain-containing protein [Oceanobacillus caeni]KKE78167.1 hypothetical protein WH51_13965 [Bacilli bacterium VT-13-104]PZD84766.1 DUF1360 domain-containing protein [Bacilli bacterium]MCR1835067.1 DUF1360 domain-containing protein [Oceanobacillus caeni]PZD86183.1 DUF1360 domain-containing protein [Bacilli bacterium]PZD89298.1 DUF1360 domain-containing protein [Bacilli bacterium]